MVSEVFPTSYVLLQSLFCTGLEDICLDIEYMTKHKPGPYWRICWAVFIPVMLVVVLVYFLATLEPLTYNNKEYPTKILGDGVFFFCFEN